MTHYGLMILRAKLERGSNGGKQMAELSSAESQWINRLLNFAYQDYPEWLESTLEPRSIATP